MVNAAGEALKITSPEISKLIHDTFQRIDPKNYEPKLVDDVIQDYSNGQKALHAYLDDPKKYEAAYDFVLPFHYYCEGISSRPLMPYKREYENFRTAACALSAIGEAQVNMSSPIVKLN
ncbi:MAG: hypothetical protein IKU37_05265 [Candidatus Gastranaerophilales bacterium]|nr:hypothetical protein [Candidatus Gastranaerophilales bacterium]